MKNRNLLISCLTVLSLLFLSSYAYALPEGQQVVSGNAEFSQPDATTLNINTSDRVIINYQSFSIAQPETVQFVQPSSSSIALNRVVGVDPSSILGTLSANGRIFLTNPNGILFGPNSRVDAAGLVASTLNISNDDFLNGRFNFQGQGGYILNQGNLVAKPGGYVCLMAGAVENQGLVQADLGTAVLASGEKLTLNLDDAGSISVVIDEGVGAEIFGPDGEKIDSAIKNSGKVQANGGRVILSARVLNNVFDYAINNSGILEAKSLAEKDGEIVLAATGAPIINTGRIEAGDVKIEVEDSDFINEGEVITDGSAQIPDAGNIFIEAVNILQSGLISANAYNEGDAGEIAIISVASTVLDENSTTSATCPFAVGNGGRIYINSLRGNTSVLHNASIDVSAGSIQGDAGFIEVSAHNQLGFYGILSGRAPPGYQSATVLFDPEELTGDVILSDGSSYTLTSPDTLTINANITVTNGNITLIAGTDFILVSEKTVKTITSGNIKITGLTVKLLGTVISAGDLTITGMPLDDGGAPSIQTAINAIGTVIGTSTINVAAGTYTEQINIEKPLTIIGAGVDSTHIISPDPTTMTIYDLFGSKAGSNQPYIVHRGTNIPVVRIASSDVTFEGFHVDLNDQEFFDVKGSFGIVYSKGVGILVDHVETTPDIPDQFTGIIIQNNKIDGLLWDDYSDCIKVLASAIVDINNNILYGYGESAVSAQGMDNPRAAFYPTVTANNNTMYGGSGAREDNHYFFGVGYWSGATGSADGNTIYNAPNGNGYALNSWTPNSVSFTNNIIRTDGGTVGGYGAQLYESSNLIFSGNNIQDQGLAGAIWKGGGTGITITITNNEIINCIDGFIGDGLTAGSVTLHYNNFEGTADGHYALDMAGHGVSIWGSADPCTIVADATRNYWGNATGPDDDAEKINGSGDKISTDVDAKPWYATSTTTPEREFVTVNPEEVRAYSDTIQGGIDAAIEANIVRVLGESCTGVVDIDKNITVQLLGEVTSTGNFSNTSGTLDVNNFLLTINGNFSNPGSIVTSSGGDINITANETDPEVPDGNIEITGSAITDGGNITLTAYGDIKLALLDAGYEGGDVSVTSTNGSILDSDGGIVDDDEYDIIGNNVTLWALGDIGRSGSGEEIELQYSGVFTENKPPLAPTYFIPSHTIGTFSDDNTIDIYWTVATDLGYPPSGVAGYAYLWDTLPDTVPGPTSAVGLLTTSPALSNGSHYFHIRTKDNSGNWSTTTPLGPFFIDTTINAVLSSNILPLAALTNVPVLIGQYTMSSFNPTPTFYFYHPLTPVDSSAFDDIILDEGAYEFIEDTLKFKKSLPFYYSPVS